MNNLEYLLNQLLNTQQNISSPRDILSPPQLLRQQSHPQQQCSSSLADDFDEDVFFTEPYHMLPMSGGNQGLVQDDDNHSTAGSLFEEEQRMKFYDSVPPPQVGQEQMMNEERDYLASLNRRSSSPLGIMDSYYRSHMAQDVSIRGGINSSSEVERRRLSFGVEHSRSSSSGGAGVNVGTAAPGRYSCSSPLQQQMENNRSVALQPLTLPSAQNNSPPIGVSHLKRSSTGSFQQHQNQQQTTPQEHAGQLETVTHLLKNIALLEPNMPWPWRIEAQEWYGLVNFQRTDIPSPTLFYPLHDTTFRFNLKLCWLQSGLLSDLGEIELILESQPMVLVNWTLSVAVYDMRATLPNGTANNKMASNAANGNNNNGRLRRGGQQNQPRYGGGASQQAVSNGRRPMIVKKLTTSNRTSCDQVCLCSINPKVLRGNQPPYFAFQIIAQENI